MAVISKSSGFLQKSKMCSVIGFFTPFKTILHFSQPPSPLFRLCAIFQDVTPTNQTILSADTAAAARHLRCHLIAIFLSVHGLQRHLVTGLQIGQPAEVFLVIMSRNEQIFRICTAGISADSIRCLFIANSHYNCRGEPYSSSLQWLDLFSELLFTESHPKAACQAHCGDHQ